MAVTQNTYTGNGSTVLFSFTFPYLETTDIKVTLDGTPTTAYTLANATTIQFNTAPANGTAIRIYRVTDDAELAAEFFPGSAIRAQDLNDNFTQNLYVTQESNRDASQALSTANSATSTANTALANSQTAIATANTADANATTAVATANTASTNASAAVSTANTASANASAAVTTANSAATDAATALSTANTADTNASTALSTANTALSTANTASTNATTAVSTATTASTNASSAVSTANTASSNASTALSTANTALSAANAAASAVANAILYDTVANPAAIPASPSNNDAVEVVDATGIESFTPLSNMPVGFVGDAGLSVRLIYTTANSSWNWVQYFPNDPDTRYAGPNTLVGTAAEPSIAFGPIDMDTGIFSPGADEIAIVTGGTVRLSVDPAGAVDVPGALTVNGGQVILDTDVETVTDAMIANGVSPLKIDGTAVVDNDPRLTDERTPADGSVTEAKLSAGAAQAGQVLTSDGSGNLSWGVAEGYRWATALKF